jgi:hypothetical protein
MELNGITFGEVQERSFWRKQSNSFTLSIRNQARVSESCDAPSDEYGYRKKEYGRDDHQGPTSESQNKSKEASGSRAEITKQLVVSTRNYNIPFAFWALEWSRTTNYFMVVECGVAVWTAWEPR